MSTIEKGTISKESDEAKPLIRAVDADLESLHSPKKVINTTRPPVSAGSDHRDDALQPTPTEHAYPKPVYFIIGNEFCERFSFYGMKTILYQYLSVEGYLGLSKDHSTAIVHTFVMFAYFFPIMGAILSDAYIGRYKTILYLSIIYSIGNLVLAFTSIPYVTGNPPHWWGAALGLCLLAVGTGGIKPCVSSFGGDQFHPSQITEIQTFFSMFYFAINAGSVLSTLLTPEMRSWHCFGINSCYPVAFGVPAILMIVATLIFVAGSKFYKHVPLKGNIFYEVAEVIYHGLSRAIRRNSIPVTPDINQQNTHWLDKVSPEFGSRKVAEVKQLLNLLFMFIPLPIFWALFDQQSSRWIEQAKSMKYRFGGFEIKPDQMQFANALFILILIPIFERFLYPAIRSTGYSFTPLKRMFTGMIIVGCSFVVASILQSTIDTSPANSVSILWQLPQYLVITAGEVMFSITGLEFAYSQAPKSMKSICQAAWLLTVAAGNLVVVVIAESNLFPPAQELLFFAILIFVAAIIFAFMAVYYKYQDGIVSEEETDRQNLTSNEDIIFSDSSSELQLN